MQGFLGYVVKIVVMLDCLLLARRIGFRWRATRAPRRVAVRMGGADRPAFSVPAHPVACKAINSGGPEAAPPAGRKPRAFCIPSAFDTPGYYEAARCYSSAATVSESLWPPRR